MIFREDIQNFIATLLHIFSNGHSFFYLGLQNTRSIQYLWFIYYWWIYRRNIQLIRRKFQIKYWKMDNLSVVKYLTFELSSDILPMTHSHEIFYPWKHNSNIRTKVDISWKVSPLIVSKEKWKPHLIFSKHIN